MSRNPFLEESVYNWIPSNEGTEVKKTPRYVSKFRPAVVLERKQQRGNGKLMKTMGPAQVELPSSEKYLKKQSAVPKPPENALKESCKRPCGSVRKPAVPTKTEPPLMGIPPKGNFKETTAGVPRKPEPVLVDSKQGHREVLENSGLVPKYIKKNDYGKTPVYLQRRRDAKQKAHEQDMLEWKERAQQAIQRLPDEERQAVLEGLRQEWNTYMQMYQRVPFMIENPSQKANKIELEKRMDELEKKINLIERFKTIYISNDEVSHGDRL